jgi:hypothetical protein
MVKWIHVGFFVIVLALLDVFLNINIKGLRNIKKSHLNSPPLARIEMKSLVNIKAIFFLACNSDQRKLVAGLEKKAFMEQACNGKLDWLLTRTAGR